MLALAKNYDKALEDEEKMTPGRRAYINDVTFGMVLTQGA